MKHIFFITLMSLLFFSTNLLAQSQSITYQGIAINATGQRVTNQTITLRLSILTESVSVAAIYVETQATISTATGTFTIQVGQGNAVSGTFASINWMANPHFLKVEMDITGGTNYTFVSTGQVLANAIEAPTPIAWQCGSSINVNHVAGVVAPISKTVTYGTVTNIPGETTKCWITSNLGADHQATAVNDASEASAGWYWQFNRKQGYKNDGSTVTPVWTITSINETSDWLTANDPCTSELGAGWRLPTSTEWTNLDVTGNWNDWFGPWSSGLKLHAAGILLRGDGSLTNRGSNGLYWSSSQYNNNIGWVMLFKGGGSYMYYSGKDNGFSVRCLKD